MNQRICDVTTASAVDHWKGNRARPSSEWLDDGRLRIRRVYALGALTKDAPLQPTDLRRGILRKRLIGEASKARAGAFLFRVSELGGMQIEDDHLCDMWHHPGLGLALPRIVFHKGYLRLLHLMLPGDARVFGFYSGFAERPFIGVRVGAEVVAVLSSVEAADEPKQFLPGGTPSAVPTGILDWQTLRLPVGHMSVNNPSVIAADFEGGKIVVAWTTQGDLAVTFIQPN